MKFVCLMLLAATLRVFGEERAPVADDAAKQAPPVREIGPDTWEVGRVRLNKNTRTVEFPAVVNMDNGLGEYLLVHVKGKLHESVLRTDVDPYQIHLAMLLLGVKGATTNDWPESPTGRIPGVPVSIEVVWKHGKKERRLRAEELILDQSRNAPMRNGTWTYNGSLQLNGLFLAQQTGSIISVITDPEALVNNPRPLRENDDNWVINTKKVPALETLVTVRIQVIPRPR